MGNAEAIITGIAATAIGIATAIVWMLRQLRDITIEDEQAPEVDKPAPAGGLSISSGRDTSIGGDVTAGDRHGDSKRKG